MAGCGEGSRPHPTLVDGGVAGTCAPCQVSSDCGGGGVCLALGGAGRCAIACGRASDCASGEGCLLSTSMEGHDLFACLPAGGSCAHGGGCGHCASGTVCDPISAQCVPSGNDGGVEDASIAADGGPSIPGVVGPNGGTVSRLLFAVMGDTRPATQDDTAGYPSSVIDTIFGDIEAMNPHPQFVIATGDYMNADPQGSSGVEQVAKFASSSRAFSGPTFAALGHMDCTGTTSGNCARNRTNNYSAWFDALVRPLGKAQPYYSIPIDDTAGKWKAKLLVVACNAWDVTQKNWLSAELRRPTTYTFIVRHEPDSSYLAPCVLEMDTMLLGASYQLLIVGHSHTYSHSSNRTIGHQLVVGNAGSPLTGQADFGYAIIEQLASGVLQVTQYDYITAMPLGSFTLN